MSKLFIWFKNVDIFEYIENRIISQLNAFLACAQNDLCYNLSETEMNKEDEEIKKEVSGFSGFDNCSFCDLSGSYRSGSCT